MKKSANPSPVNLIAGIRFQLDQLGAQNGHHDFEHLCRHFARETITPALLPATGPVSAGGDQGKDFESFTTFIAAKKTETSVFWGEGESKPLVFACSICKKSKVKAKVQSDAREICLHRKPYIIYFFSNQDVSVAVRHDLQDWCSSDLGVKLEIIDAQALSERLAEPRLFWIAEEFLHVPADLFPRPAKTDDRHYDALRTKWLEHGTQPLNYADFVEVKLGLRRATFNEKLKPDISGWIRVLEGFLAESNPEELQRRATYEICVAALRGQHNLTAKSNLVESYFTKWGTPDECAQLRDATILLSYCSSAKLAGEFDFDPNILHAWSKALVAKLDKAIASAPGPNALADLLQTRAHTAQLAFLKGDKPLNNLDEAFKWWFKSIVAAKKAPLFPIEDFADLLTKVAPFIGQDERFVQLTRRVDALLEERSKGYLVAEKSRDRAMEFIKAHRTLAAINELHRAKVRWFTGDALRGTLLTLLTLSDAYMKLGLVYAAKYHALGAAYIIVKSTDEDITPLLTDALYQIGNCEYAAGEWITFADRFALFLSMHYRLESDPDDWERHEKLKWITLHFLIMRSLAKALGGELLAALVERPLRELSMPDELREEILAPPLSLEHYETMLPRDVMAKASEDLWAPPFSDLGARRTYRWRALGIAWMVECENSSLAIPYVEEFVAVLQIAIADLAQTDLCLLPTSVQLDVIVLDTFHFGLKAAPDNARLVFNLSIPRCKTASADGMRETQGEVLGVANTLLVWCSVLPDSEIRKRLKAAYKDELSAKAFLVRPYWELLREFSSQSDPQPSRTDFSDIDVSAFNAREHAELAWQSGPGIGYLKGKAIEFLGNRYRRGIIPIRRTVARLRVSGRFKQWVSNLRDQGMRDWQILLVVANAVIDFRAKAMVQPFDMKRHEELSRQRLNQEEPEDALPFPEEILYSQESEMFQQINLLSNAHTWGLQVRASTPDFAAWKKLLDVRYFQSTDDIPHDDFFSE